MNPKIIFSCLQKKKSNLKTKSYQDIHLIDKKAFISPSHIGSHTSWVLNTSPTQNAHRRSVLFRRRCQLWSRCGWVGVGGLESSAWHTNIRWINEIFHWARVPRSLCVSGYLWGQDLASTWRIYARETYITFFFRTPGKMNSWQPRFKSQLRVTCTGVHDLKHDGTGGEHHV